MRSLHAGAALTLLLLCASRAPAQDLTESSLKAAFVYNFAKFTDWPPDALPANTPFTACVLGDVPVRDALARIVKGRVLAGRGITVLRVDITSSLRACHLLYVSSISPAQVVTILAMVQGGPTLTISDLDDFAQLGGIAHVFVENGRMRFDLNLDLARRSRLLLSSKLLALATSVDDGPGKGSR